MPEPLQVAGETAGHLMTRRRMLGDAAKIAAAAAVTGAVGTVVVRALGGGRPQAPGGGPLTIQIPFTYSTEKSAWLQPLIADYNNRGVTLNGKTVVVVPDARGSVDALQKILSGDLTPIVWSPASTLELNQLAVGWAANQPSTRAVRTDNDFAPRSLVSSPLVLLAWQDRAALLRQRFGGLDWQSLHQALTARDGWAGIPGGNAAWGLVKFGQTRPDRSNSGLLTLALLALAVTGSNHSLSVADVRADSYLQFMRGFEDAVNQFGSSSGTFLDCVVRYGAAEFDIVTTYEHLALARLAASGAPPLALTYPNPTMVSDHPFAILSRASDDQASAAKAFRDFLLAAEQQRHALAYGLRPAAAGIRLSDTGIPGNLFARQIPNVQVTLRSAIAPAPGGDVVNALIDGWNQFYQDRPSTPGC